MMTLPDAKLRAEALGHLTGEPHLVFRTPADAPCNQAPANLHNKGRFAVCRASERDDYEAGGAEFSDCGVWR